MRKGKDVNLDECELACKTSKEIILKAYEQGGTTIRSYTSQLGVYGNYQNFLMVHARELRDCKVCGTLIKKIRVGGRGTYFCPTCQK